MFLGGEMSSWCKWCGGLTTHVQRRIKGMKGAVAWFCQPCVTLGYTAAREQLEHRRKYWISSPWVFDEKVEEIKEMLKKL